MRTRTRILAVVMLVVILGAFLAGFWPERQRRAALESANTSLQTRVSSLEDRVRLSRLHVRLLDLIDAVTQMNYGQAQSLSSTFFDEAGAEAARMQDPTYRDVLREMVGRRDAITTALAKGDPATLEPLREMEGRVRRVLAGAPPVAA